MELKIYNFTEMNDDDQCEIMNVLNDTKSKIRDCLNNINEGNLDQTQFDFIKKLIQNI